MKRLLILTAAALLTVATAPGCSSCGSSGCNRGAPCNPCTPGYGGAGYGAGYGDTPNLPFFKNFYMGGVNSLRGFRSFTVGPKDIQGNPRGGSHKILGNAEFLFPFPGMGAEKSVRLSAFADAGMTGESFAFGDLRYSTGMAVLWVSPMGPLKISVGIPLKDKPDDRKQIFQFTFGGAF